MSYTISSPGWYLISSASGELFTKRIYDMMEHPSVAIRVNKTAFFSSSGLKEDVQHLSNEYFQISDINSPHLRMNPNLGYWVLIEQYEPEPEPEPEPIPEPEPEPAPEPEPEPIPEPEPEPEPEPQPEPVPEPEPEPIPEPEPEPAPEPEPEPAPEPEPEPAPEPMP